MEEKEDAITGKSPATPQEFDTIMDNTNYQTNGQKTMSAQEMELTMQILKNENLKLRMGLQKMIEGKADHAELKNLLENDMQTSIGRNSSPSVKAYLFGSEQDDKMYKTDQPRRKAATFEADMDGEQNNQTNIVEEE